VVELIVPIVAAVLAVYRMCTLYERSTMYISRRKESKKEAVDSRQDGRKAKSRQ
jgi:uncharacterized protein YxeA